MKQTIKNILAIAMVVGLLAAHAPQAQAFGLVGGKGEAQGSFAVLNVTKLMSESDAAKSLKEQLDVEKSALLSENSEQEKKLTEERKKLKDAPEAEIKAFYAKVAKLKDKAQAKKAALDDRSGRALLKIRDAILKASKKVMDANGYDAVFAQQSVVLLKGDINITAEVLELLNKELPKVEL